MNVIPLSPWDLVFGALLVVALSALTAWMRVGITRSLVVAGARTVVQLLLVGYVLKALFATTSPGWVALVAAIMLVAAGREAVARQKRPLAGPWRYGVGTFSMFVSTFSVTVFALLVVVGPDPWYAPRYAIPLLGMMLGNSMTGVALATDRLTQGAAEGRAVIEARLTLGASAAEAIAPMQRDAIRVGLIPIINAMAAAGIVSLPGMMTGQILAGSPPVEAVQYQILVMFMVTAVTGFGAVISVYVVGRRLFDERERLRLDRLRPLKG